RIDHDQFPLRTDHSQLSAIRAVAQLAWLLSLPAVPAPDRGQPAAGRRTLEDQHAHPAAQDPLVWHRTSVTAGRTRRRRKVVLSESSVNRDKWSLPDGTETFCPRRQT